MGWFTKRGRAPMTMVQLRGGREIRAVGEASYQASLDRICGGKTQEGVHLQVTAHLVREPSNPYDPNAVKVMVGEAHVGYLCRADAKAYKAALIALERNRQVGAVNALINGGWRRGNGDEGHYGVVLDLAPPAKVLG